MRQAACDYKMPAQKGKGLEGSSDQVSVELRMAKLIKENAALKQALELVKEQMKDTEKTVQARLEEMIREGMSDQLKKEVVDMAAEKKDRINQSKEHCCIG
jgi:phenylalanyl-tRNA synthetase alpha subunit